MHGLPHAAATAWLTMLAAAVGHGEDAPAPPASVAIPPPRIVVAFSNQRHDAPGPSGATGSRYDGGGYRTGQFAQRQARRIAAVYTLRPVASWPIEALSVYCVVFEVTHGQAVPEVLAALSKEKGVVLAQPLHQFHTPDVRRPPDPRPDVLRVPPVRPPAPRPRSPGR
jgi:hypothetical protein